jgi:chromosomal replication initiation ATPase DnaA
MHKRTQEVVIANVLQILEIVGKNKSNFSEMCKDNGIKIDKSVFTRHDNGQVMGMDKLDELVRGLNLFEKFKSITAADLLNPNLLSTNLSEPKAQIDISDLKKVIAKYLIDLHELGWSTLKSEMPLETMTDFAVLAFKNSGFDMVKTSLNLDTEKSA